MLLTLKLLPLIEKHEKSRIVTVTSGAQFFGKVGWNNLKAENYYNKWESYANSKLANVMFALELNEQLEQKNILSLAAHPGIAKTNLFSAQKPKPSPIETFSLELFSPIFQSAEMGALPQYLLLLLLRPREESITGLNSILGVILNYLQLHHLL